MSKLKKIPVIDISWDAEGILIERNNRFLGTVDIPDCDLKNVMVHIRDPGRLENILYPGNKLLLKKRNGKNRKTNWELIAARVKNEWILVNSGYHHMIARYIIENDMIPSIGKIEKVMSEKRFGDSRLDFLILNHDGSKIWTEVKGCTMAEKNTALFPDAVTSRGKRHIEELIRIVEMGDRALLLILIFRPESKCFAPNNIIDPEFSRSFELATNKGVLVHPVILKYENGTIYYLSEIPLCK
ncbi:sugar fermentation stimulation protein [Methanosalsum zhilinae DSM 4017]|uniref:Sugar fermentation stimulation protein homolog n=1 Tax=Methanosalsum zhilinae (strain DSM 4017 / NBRC 107636 / OCM 62 / WeN5) TaxID=679901 RepID=F7XM12_METZD|nr:DNA/RNA nuclease SfsA [Methanosalsum zhilinae]AEH60949.1 sugar fermentation stimulation protein [Methanosalsum zhilinae DSM 4017]